MTTEESIRMFALHIGHDVYHPEHGIYKIDGVYSKGVFVVRGSGPEAEFEEFNFSELTIVNNIDKHQAEMDIQGHIEEITGLSFETFRNKSKSRKTELVEIRMLYMVWLLKCRNMSLSQAGEVWGKDHATALHALNEIRNRVNNYEFQDKYSPIIDIILKFNHKAFEYERNKTTKTAPDKL
jgi:hypothetical protein